MYLRYVSRLGSTPPIISTWVGEMSTGLCKKLGRTEFGLRGSTVYCDKLLNGATQDYDNHAGCDPMNLTPYACSGLSTRKNNRSLKNIN